MGPRLWFGAALVVGVAALVALFLSSADHAGDGGAPIQARDGEEGPEKAIWGPTELPGGGSAFPVYEELGVETFQYQLTWSEIAPTRPGKPADPGDPAYRWPEDLDAAQEEAEKRGINLALLVTTSPGWANGGRDPIWAPEDDADLAAFLGAAAERYPAVRRWMIWGEPNRGDRFQPNRVDDPVGPERYARMLAAAHEALKAASADNLVIGGMTWTGGEVKPPDFVRWMRLPSGEPPPLDLYGHNPYPFRFPDLDKDPFAGGWRDLSDLDTLSAELRETYAPLGREPPLWLSEFTVQSDHDSRYFAFSVSREEQARWLRVSYGLAGSLPNVAGLGWFTLLDEPEATGSANWGLMTSTGERKPAFDEYAAVEP